MINIDLINYYNSPGNYLNLINFAINNNINLKELDLKNFLDILIKDNHYKKNNFIKANIFNFIELYFLKILIKNKNKNFIIKNYTDMIYKNSNTSLFNLDYESLFMEFRSKILNG